MDEGPRVLRGFRNELRSAWTILERPKAAEFNALPIISAGPTTMAALDPEGFRHLLVPATPESDEHDERPGALRISTRQLSFKRRAGSYVDICCTDPSLFGEFDTLLVEILERAKEVSEPAVEAMAVVARWRQLLRPGRPSGLGEDDRLALFAELSMLAALAESDAETASADWWRSPDGAHGFELPAACLVVKALRTTASTGRLRVRSLTELDRHDDRPLSLVMATVMPDGDGISVLGLVERLRSLLASDAVLDARLTVARVSPDDALLTAATYSIASVFVVTVGTATPRLVPSTYAAGTLDGVVDVSYELDIATLLAHARPTTLAGVASSPGSASA